jgi:SWI/SNF-related matrix-associated actin-dependent regulator 1 of chromatin subfamily A
MGTLSIKKKEKALEILTNYDGTNPEIKRLKYNLSKKPNFALNDLNYEYILSNYENNEPILINKTVKIAKWFGEKMQKNYDIEFIPEKLKISYIVGETQLIYHCYVKYRGSQNEYMSLFLPKKALLNPLFKNNWEDTEVDINKLDKLLERVDRKIKEHQIPAIKFLLGSKKCILADEQGLAKTASLIGASILGNFEHILIICPASLKTNWKKELSFFGIDDVSVIEGTKPENWDFNKKYVICNFDIFDEHLHKVAWTTVIDEVLVKDEITGEEKIVSKERKVKSRKKEYVDEVMENNPLIQADFDLVIIDEVHRLSNSTSNRYKAIKDYLQKSKIKNIYLATGTPISNNAKNYYNLLSLIDCEISWDYMYYMKQYCGAHEITLKTGRKVLVPGEDRNLNELMEKTKHVYLRRLKDVLKDLPNRNIVERYYDLTKEEEEEYKKLWEEYEQAQIDLGNIDPTQLDELNRQLVEGGLLRQYLAKTMIPHTIELAEEHIEDGSKIIIGCCFNIEVDLLKEHFKNKCVIYKGGMTTKQKDKAQEEFTNNPKIKVFIGNIQSAGVGLTLVSSNITIMNSYDWVPSSNEQFQDRNFRLGQTKDVTTYYQLFNNTYSEHVWNTLIKKLMTIDTVIKDEKNK